MSWRKGLLRLWLVLSVCWAVPTGIVTFGTYARDQDAIRIADRCFEHSNVAKDHASVRKQASSDFLNSLPDWDEHPAAKERAAGKEKHATGPVTFDDLLRENPFDCFDGVPENTGFFTPVEATFGPPFLVLLLGAMFYWALSGFRP